VGGIVGHAGPAAKELIGALSERLRHRGAFGRSVVERGFALAERGTVEKTGVAVSADGRVRCVLDGRLFNRPELSSELGLDPRLRDDARVVAELLARHGASAFERLDGAFGLAAVVDDTLHVVRDPLGEKPLYFAPDVGGVLLFGSEIKAFLAHPAFRVEADWGSLSSLLVYSFIPGRRTAFTGVQELEPGCRLEVGPGGGHRVLRYWELEERISPASEDEQRELLRTLLFDAVKRRLPEEGPITAFLSGGIDSSAVVAILSELGRPPRCVSCSFGFGQPNELLYATMVSVRHGLAHEVLDVHPGEFLDQLPRIMWALDDPLCDCITVPNYLLAQEAARHGSVVFNGEGGDPLFGGPKNKFMILGEWYAFLGGYDRTKAYLASYHKFYDYVRDLYSPEFLEVTGGREALEEHVRKTLETSRFDHYLNRLMHVNIRLKGGQNILVKVDKMLTPNGVEPSSPLFDRRLAEHSFTVPPALKRKGDVEKYLFKKAVEDILPHPVVYRKKAGMGVPLNHWFKKTPLRRYTRDILGSARARQRGLFQQSFVDNLLHGELPLGHLGRDRTGELLWMILAVELWHRVYVDGEHPE
jgi:asparagine synthase (glutamine-hydrolysing)